MYPSTGGVTWLSIPWVDIVLSLQQAEEKGEVHLIVKWQYGAVPISGGILTGVRTPRTGGRAGVSAGMQEAIDREINDPANVECQNNELHTQLLRTHVCPEYHRCKNSSGDEKFTWCYLVGQKHYKIKSRHMEKWTKDILTGKAVVNNM